MKMKRIRLGEIPTGTAVADLKEQAVFAARMAEDYEERKKPRLASVWRTTATRLRQELLNQSGAKLAVFGVNEYGFPYYFNADGMTIREVVKRVKEGDKANSKLRAVSWPFYDFGNCSEFLASVLHDLTFDETKAVYINAHDTDGQMYVNDCLRAKPFMKVICFGSKAYDTMSPFTRKIHKVMHPSYAKRFNKRQEFLLQLEEVING
jgi:hypothetical protein